MDFLTKKALRYSTSLVYYFNYYNLIASNEVEFPLFIIMVISIGRKRSDSISNVEGGGDNGGDGTIALPTTTSTTKRKEKKKNKKGKNKRRSSNSMTGSSNKGNTNKDGNNSSTSIKDSLET